MELCKAGKSGARSTKHAPLTTQIIYFYTLHCFTCSYLPRKMLLLMSEMLLLMSVRLKIAAGTSAKHTGRHDETFSPSRLQPASVPEGK